MHRLRRRTGWAIPLVLLAASCRARDPAPQVGFYKLDDQRLSGVTDVVSPTAGTDDLTVLVTVDTAGHVVAARPVDNFSALDPAPGLAAVRRWRFRPQRFEGKPVVAVGMVSVAYHVPEVPADSTAAFPSAYPANTEITLDRAACYGSCPSYRVTIRGDGEVRFSTDDPRYPRPAATGHLGYNGYNVVLPGTHVAHVNPAAVARLLDRFRAAHFFGLRDKYVAFITDQSTQRLTVRIGGARKTVTDYMGHLVGMPRAVRELEALVDTVAGTRRWVEGDGDTLSDLDRQGFDVRSHAAAELTAAAVWKRAKAGPSARADAFIVGLIDRGVPLDTPLEKSLETAPETPTDASTLGDALVGVAAASGDEVLFARLVERGRLARMTRDALNRTFVRVGCSPPIARALVRAGADPRFVGSDGGALNGLTGVARVCGEDEARTLAMARTLIALGAPLEARSELGWTPLMGCDSPALARLMLAHGADPNAHGKNGMRAVLSTDDDRVALILLRAGADPRSRNAQGSLREQAAKHHMPATLAWLDAHHVT